MGEFNSATFEQMLTGLKSTQDSIQAMSVWCLKHRANHKKVVASWLSVLKQVKVEHRLVLFYLANDVIQHSKRKRYEYVDSWSTTLQRATTMVRDEKVKSKIIRIFNIWEERNIYNDDFLADLRDLLSINPAKKQQTVVEADDEQIALVCTSIRSCVRLEQETDRSFKKLHKMPKLYDMDGIQALKDRRHVEDVQHNMEEYSGQLESYLRTLNAELEARKALLSVLEQTEAFYHNQRGEVKVVTNAYRNFGNRIKTMKRRLDDLCTTLPSPIPSPDINAPSPEPDNDFDLPDFDESKPFDNSLNNTNGFLNMDHSKLPFNISDFGKSDSPTSDGQPIQVIGSSNVSSDAEGPSHELGADFNIDEFFKSLLHDTEMPSDSYGSPQGGSANPQPVPPVTSATNDFTPAFRYTEIPGMGNYEPPPAQTTSQHQHHQSAQHSSYGQAPNSSYYQPARTQSPPPPSRSHYTHPSPVPPPSVHTNPYRSGHQQQHATPYPSHTPLAPPPPPPSFEGDSGQNDEYNPENWDMNVSWNSERDASFSRGGAHMETPVSPPHYDRKATGATREYVDRSGEWPMTGTSDVDQRQLRLPESTMSAINKERIRSLDVDHRNLISLTGSPTGKPADALLAAPPMRSNDNASLAIDPPNPTLLPTPGTSQKIPLLEPPPQMSNNLMDILNHPDQAPVSKSMPPPSFNSPPSSGATSGQRQPFKRSPSVGSYSRDGTPSKRRASGGQRDHVEAVDMEMSDEDYEDPFGRDASTVEDDIYEASQQQQDPHHHQQQMQHPQQQQQQQLLPHHHQQQHQHMQPQQQHHHHQRPPRPFNNNFGPFPGGGGGFGFPGGPNNAPRQFYQGQQPRHMLPTRGWVNNPRRQRPPKSYNNVWTNNNQPNNNNNTSATPNSGPNPRNPFSMRKF